MTIFKMYNGFLICYLICELSYNVQSCVATFQGITSIFPKTPRILRSIPYSSPVTEHTDYDRDTAVYLEGKDSGYVFKDVPKSSISGCGCGEKGDNPDEELWHLFIFIVKTQETLPVVERICSATIVSSNLILTSHKCFQIGNKKVNIYDIWEPKPWTSNMFNQSQIFISKKLCISSHGLQSEFRILKIIYHPRYALISFMGEFPRSDVVIVKVDADFTEKNSNFKPICFGALQRRLFDKDESGYGLALDVSESFASANDCSDMEKRVRLKMYPDSKLQLKKFKGTFVRGECRYNFVNAGREIQFPHLNNKAFSRGHYDGIMCIKSSSKGNLYLLEGSPWISFRWGNMLHGLSTNTTVAIGDTDVTIYAQGEDIVRYILWQGNREETKWCNLY